MTTASDQTGKKYEKFLHDCQKCGQDTWHGVRKEPIPECLTLEWLDKSDLLHDGQGNFIHLTCLTCHRSILCYHRYNTECLDRLGIKYAVRFAAKENPPQQKNP